MTEFELYFPFLAMQTAVAIEVDPFQNFSLEVWDKIFTLLPVIDRVRCARVSNGKQMKC